MQNADVSKSVHRVRGKAGADLWAEIPEDEVVVGASRDQLVASLG